MTIQLPRPPYLISEDKTLIHAQWSLGELPRRLRCLVSAKRADCGNGQHYGPA